MTNLLAGREYVDWALLASGFRVLLGRILYQHFRIEENVFVDTIANLSRKTQERRVKLIVARANIVSEETYTGLCNLHLVDVSGR